MSSNGFYFDEREQRTKRIPDCQAAHPSLYWDTETCRCELEGAPVRRYRRMPVNQAPPSDGWEFGYCGYLDDESQIGLGFLPAAALAPAAASGPLAPIVLGVASAISAIASIFKGFGAQRGRDEATSGDYLNAADAAKNQILVAYQAGQISEQQAKDLFEREVIGGFVSRINALKTESVRESRTLNQVNDLRNLFYGALPQFAPSGGGDDGGSGIDPFDLASGALDIFGNPIGGGSGGNNQPVFEPSRTSEILGDDGSYYYEDSQTGEWFYDDGQGNSYGGSGQGDSYAIEANGDYYETDVAGNFYYEAPSGEWYYEDAGGNWSSGDSSGYGCNGDAGNNWSCSDGSKGSSDTLSIKDRQNRQKAPQRRGTPQQAKATGTQKAIQLAQQGAAILQRARQQAQASAAQQKRLASAATINSAGARNPQVRAITGASANANGGSGLGGNTLLLLGIGAVALIAFGRK